MVDSSYGIHMLKATLEVGVERLDVYFCMLDERAGAIYTNDGARLVRIADDAVDNHAVLRPTNGSPISITITRRNLTTGLTWNVGSLTFSLRADPPPASER